MSDLKPAEIEAAKFVLDVFGDGEAIDGTMLGKFCYSNKLYPTVDTLKKLGMTEKKGEKKFKIDDLLPIISQLKKDVKSQGCYDDFLECLKLYDKEENGMMPVGDLAHSLLSMGEKLTDVEVDELMEDCVDEEDEDGMIPYVRAYRKINFIGAFFLIPRSKCSSDHNLYQERCTGHILGFRCNEYPKVITYNRGLKILTCHCPENCEEGEREGGKIDTWYMPFLQKLLGIFGKFLPMKFVTLFNQTN